MKIFHNILLQTILLSAVIFVSCESEDNEYNPNLDTIYDLEFEFNNLKSAVGINIRQIDTCITSKNFDFYFSDFNNTWPNINILIEDGDKKLNDSSIEGAFREKLQTIHDAMLVKKEYWQTLSDNLDELKNTNTEWLMSFNALKVSLFDPHYDSSAYLDYLMDRYAILTHSPGVEELRYFKDRTDFQYIMDYGSNIRNIEKVYTFSRLSIVTYELRFQNTIYDLYGDSVKLSYRDILSIPNNKELYDLYLKNKISFSVTSKAYEFDVISYFADNIGNCPSLLESYESLNNYYILFSTNYTGFVESKDSLEQYSNTIADIPDAEEVFNTLFGAEHPNFRELVYLGNNTDSIIGWQKDYNNLSAIISALHTSYASSDTISDFDDQADVKLSLTNLKTLARKYDNHFPEYRYFFFDQFQDISNEFNLDSTKGKLYFLLDLIGLKPDEDAEQ